MRLGRGEGVVLGLVLLLGAALRVWGLGTWCFEQDELYTLRDALAVPDGVNPMRPLYYLLQHLLLAVVPPTPVGLRLPAVVFGLAGIGLTWVLARRVFGPGAAATGAFLVAVAPWHLYASQFARYWSLVYLLAAAAYLGVLHAVEADRPRAYLAAVGTILLGVLTHPSYAFPLVGLAASLWLVSPDGRVGLRVPGPRALLWFWGPLVAAAIVWLVVIQTAGAAERSLAGGRGLQATLLVLPAIVQWADPAILAVAGLGVLGMLLRGQGTDRHWAVLVLLAVASTVTLLLVAGQRADVYADYAMAMLPLIFVTVGGAIQRVAGQLARSAGAFTVGAAAVLGAAVAPGTVSHLVDGSRFDFRPAFAHIARTAPDRALLGWPRVLQEYYAPALRFRALLPDTAYLAQALAEEGSVWVAARFNRRGLVAGNASTEEFLARSCHTVASTERQRFDYRVYRVELLWCGAEPVPESR